MWEDIEVVPKRPSDRATSRRALTELGLLVAAAIIAALLPLVS